MKIFKVNYDSNSPYVETESYYKSKSLNTLIKYHEEKYGMSYVQSIKPV
jgi:pyruvate/2-oxoacid:ferredoxin oxidoreductase beta subunit